MWCEGEPTPLRVYPWVIFEVQINFVQTFPLKVFSHAAYNLLRPQTKTLIALSTIFEFPMIDMHEKSRDEVMCKLHF